MNSIECELASLGALQPYSARLIRVWWPVILAVEMLNDAYEQRQCRDSTFVETSRRQDRNYRQSNLEQ
jgi:hypothetical protein